MKKLLFFVFFALALAFSQVALAQDEAGQEATPETTATEEVTAADLDVEEPTTLPTNGFGYFFKNLGRAIQTTLTFNQEKKAELQLKIADERLLEAKKVAEANPNNVKAQEIAAKTLEKYQQMMEKVQTRVEAIKEKNAERAEKMLDKIADHQLKQQQIMEKIEERGADNLTEEQQQKLQAVKEKALEKFGQFMERVEENQQKIKERLEKAAESAEGETEGALEKLHNLRVIQRLGDKFANEDLRQGVEEANQTVRQKFFMELNESDNGATQEFNVQLENMSGENADQLRVINFLKEGLAEQAKTEPSLNNLTGPLRKFEQNRLDNLKRELEASGNADEQQELLRPLEEAGDVKSVEVLDRLRQEVKNPKAREALQQAQERKVEKINERLEKMDDQQQVQELKKEINSAPAAQRAIRQSDPELMKKMDQRSEEIKKIQAERKSDEDRPNDKPADRPNTQNTDRPQFVPGNDNPGQNQGRGEGSSGQAGDSRGQGAGQNRPDQPQRQGGQQDRPEARQQNNQVNDRQQAPQGPQNQPQDQPEKRP